MSAAAAYPEPSTGPEVTTRPQARHLFPVERFLIEKYLTPGGFTLEAGTGDGRVLRALAKRGFHRLTGFDAAPSLIEEASHKDPSATMQLSVEDAEHLSYPDACFDQALYLQPLASFVADPERRREIIAEAQRVLKPGGVGIFSFLPYEMHLQSLPRKTMIAYLAVFRWFKGRRAPLQSMPWLSHQGKFNRDALFDRPPHVYWFRAIEAVRLLVAHRFTIVGIGTLAQIHEGRLCSSVQELSDRPIEGMLYVVCAKRWPDGRDWRKNTWATPELAHPALQTAVLADHVYSGASNGFAARTDP